MAPGTPLTYTIRVTNTGEVELHSIVTDVLPADVLPGSKHRAGTLILPGGILTWTPTISQSGGVWNERFVVTVENDYAGPLTNVVQVDTEEGVTAVYTNTIETEEPITGLSCRQTTAQQCWAILPHYQRA